MALNLGILFGNQEAMNPKVVGKGIDPMAYKQLQLQQQQAAQDQQNQQDTLIAQLLMQQKDQAMLKEKMLAAQEQQDFDNQLAREKFDFEKSIKGPAAAQDLQLGQMNLAKGQLEVNKGVREEQDIAAIRKATQEGEDAYIAALNQQDPNKVLEYLKTKQALRSLILDNKSKLADLDGKQLETAIKRASAIGNLGFVLEGIQDPMARANAYQQMLPEIKKLDPNAPTQYNQSYAVSGIVQALGIQDQVKTNPYLMQRAQLGAGRKEFVDQMDKLQANELKKSTYASTPEVIKLQDYRDQLLSEKQQLQASGQDTSALDEKIGQIEKSLNIATTPKAGDLSPYMAAQQEALAKADVEGFKTITQTAQDADEMENNINQFLQVLDGTSSALVGPVAEKTGFNRFSGDVQQLRAIGNTMALQAKSLLKMPSNTFSEADREFLVETTLNTKNGKPALKATAERLRGLVARSREAAQQYSKSMQQGVSPTLNYGLNIGRSQQGSPSTQPKQYPSKTINGVTYEKREDGWYSL